MSYEIRDEDRVAVASIRGYHYQILHTIRSWLQADDARIVIAEGNEDIDQVIGSTPEERIEESIKYRSAAIAQGDDAIRMTILRSLVAFHHHRSRGIAFTGVLRTNADINAHHTTAIGRWILGENPPPADLRTELAALVPRKDVSWSEWKTAVALLDDRSCAEFMSAVRWAPRDGDLDALKEEIRALIRQRAPRLSTSTGLNALMTGMLRILSDDDVSRRRLRRIDADVALNDAALEALQRSAAAIKQQTVAAIWSQASGPAAAVLICTQVPQRLDEACKYATRLTNARRGSPTEQEILREVLLDVDFVAYGSFRDRPGPNGERECIRDVVRQARRRHDPVAVVIGSNAPSIDAWIAKKWPAPTRSDELLVRAAAVVGAAITQQPRDQAFLAALGTKLRWVHRIDDGTYFTAERPLS